MTQKELQNAVSETKGVLFAAGYRLEKAGDDWYQVINRSTGEVFTAGSLATIYYAAHVIATKHRTPEADTQKTNDARYQAGREMAKRLNER